MRRDIGFYGRQKASVARDYALGILQVWYSYFKIILEHHQSPKNQALVTDSGRADLPKDVVEMRSRGGLLFCSSAFYEFHNKFQEALDQVLTKHNVLNNNDAVFSRAKDFIREFFKSSFAKTVVTALEDAKALLRTDIYVGFGVLSRRSLQGVPQDRHGHLDRAEVKQTPVVLDAEAFLKSSEGQAFSERVLDSGLLFHCVNFMKQLSMYGLCSMLYAHLSRCSHRAPAGRGWAP